MGGADIHNLVPRALNWLQARGFAGEVVVLSGARTFDLPKFGFDLRIINAQNEVPDWMDWCDLAVAAAGATTWELACCGVPAILSVVAENQRLLARWCEQNGVAASAGEADEHWESRLEMRGSNWIGDARYKMSRRARNAVDGQGRDARRPKVVARCVATAMRYDGRCANAVGMAQRRTNARDVAAKRAD